MNVDALLPTPAEIQAALGPTIQLTDSRQPAQIQALGDLLGAGAVETAFRSVTGVLPTEVGETALAVATLALVFGSEARAASTFDSVGQAAHLRTRLGDSMVAVETVTAPSGLVSYWGYLHHGKVILLVTLDTLDPQRVSMADFRSLVTLAATRVERRLHAG